LSRTKAEWGVSIEHAFKLALEFTYWPALFGLEGPNDMAGIFADGGGRLLELDDDLDLSFEGKLS